MEHDLLLQGRSTFLNSVAVNGTGGGLYVGMSLNASLLSFRGCTSRVTGATTGIGIRVSLKTADAEIFLDLFSDFNHK